MRKLLTAALFGTSLALAACGDAAEEADETAATDTALPPADTPAPEPTDTETPEPTDTPTPEPEPEPADDY